MLPTHLLTNTNSIISLVKRRAHMKLKKSLKNFFIHHISLRVLCMLAFLANLSAQIGAGTASSWGRYQPLLPNELSR